MRKLNDRGAPTGIDLGTYALMGSGARARARAAGAGGPVKVAKVISLAGAGVVNAVSIRVRAAELCAGADKSCHAPAVIAFKVFPPSDKGAGAGPRA